MKRVLFILHDLPRPTLSMRNLWRGQEALSGTHSSTLLIAEGLAQRGWETAVFFVGGGKLTETAIRNFDTLEEAVSWAESGHTLWSYYGGDGFLERLNGMGVTPILWSHIDVPPVIRDWLANGRLQGLLTVSDTTRISLLRSKAHRKVGRVYNPLAPHFEQTGTAAAGRFTSGSIVFAGYLNVSKGAHRLLQLWPHVRRMMPTARLLLAGSERLYGGGRKVGPQGLSSPEFELKYLAPLVDEFGSLEQAGIHPAGLLTPGDLRKLYMKCKVGIVNLNWHQHTETFCCSAVEMLATGLPVFSVARGALPETIGMTGGAALSGQEDPDAMAHDLVDLLRDESRLQALGSAGAVFVRENYGLPRILDAWERMLASTGHFETITGHWRGPKSARYRIERWAGRLGLETVLTRTVLTARTLLGRH